MNLHQSIYIIFVTANKAQARPGHYSFTALFLFYVIHIMLIIGIKLIIKEQNATCLGMTIKPTICDILLEGQN